MLQSGTNYSTNLFLSGDLISEPQIPLLPTPQPPNFLFEEFQLFDQPDLSQFPSLMSLGNETTTLPTLEFPDSLELPPDLRTMSESSKNCVIAYTILFIIASTGNLTVFASFYRQYKKNGSRISLLILHLSVADLIVSFCLIPIEIFWRMTIQWYGGDVLCKACQFMRAFGLYLSSMVLICVSFDRFFAIIFPLKALGGQHTRVKLMLWMAWIASGIFSAPQAIFFNVESHPKFPSFRQCVTSSFLSKPEDAKLYSIFSVSAMYFAPLFVVIFTYTAILLKIIRKSRQSGQGQLQQTIHLSERPKNLGNQNHINSKLYKKRLEVDGSAGVEWHKNASFRGNNSGSNLLQVPTEGDSSGTGSPCLTPNLSMNRIQIEDTSEDLESVRVSHEISKGSIKSNGGRTHLVLRMSNNACTNITRAKSRTLRLTIVIVLVFVLCWTPYCVMTLWYMFDWKTAQRVDPRVQDGLFLMAVSNSVVNPLVNLLIYGSFTRNCFGITKRLNMNKRGGGPIREPVTCTTNSTSLN